MIKSADGQNLPENLNQEVSSKDDRQLLDSGEYLAILRDDFLFEFDSPLNSQFHALVSEPDAFVENPVLFLDQVEFLQYEALSDSLSSSDREKLEMMNNFQLLTEASDKEEIQDFQDSQQGSHRSEAEMSKSSSLLADLTSEVRQSRLILDRKHQHSENE
ncbi:MAG: hypothetical protein LBV19_09635 [Streptococcaceae bacterium]|jgi:hypothetical protein|nr:hypothetical protein [Streptococcaceae bacterium]